MPDTCIPPPSHSFTPDQQRRRTAFIEAATAVFAERGFDAATTREIAARAGCAEGLIHRYFGGKHGLLAAILDDRAERLAEWFQADFPDLDDIDAEIEALLVRPLDHMWEKRDFMRVVSHQSIVEPEIGRKIAAMLHGQRVALIRDKLARYRDRGLLAPDADIEATAETLSLLVYALGFQAQTVMGAGRDEVRRTAHAAAALIARGLRASDSTPTPTSSEAIA
jgi:AcrR family transcriptional regulator